MRMNNIIEMLCGNKKLAESLTTVQTLEFFHGLKRDERVLPLKTAEQMIELFGILCWQLESKEQRENCFAVFKDALKKVQNKGTLVEKLMEYSYSYQPYVFLAKELLHEIEPEQRKNLKVYPLSWTTTDDYTDISIYEYLWRLKQGYPCSKHEDGFGVSYRRPMSMLDIQCFKDSLDIILEIGRTMYLYQH